MKYSNSDYTTLYTVIRQLVNFVGKQHLLTKYETGQFLNSHAVKDLNKRFMWDLLWNSNAHRLIDMSDYNDKHTETALRRVLTQLDIPELIKRY